ncbi:MAG: S8 family serine peptidase [Bacteroidia bacterium]|nr:S8 family serine peptidase [Bacteroidia bacterium]
MKLSTTAGAFLMASVLLVSSLLADSPKRHTSSPAQQVHSTLEVNPNLVIIKFKPRTSFVSGGNFVGVSSVDAILQRVGATQVESFGRMNETSLKKAGRPELHSERMVKIHYTAGDDPRDLAKELSLDATVEYAEPYYIFPLHRTPNDPRLGQQWAIGVMKLAEAWDISTGDSTIVIGNVDTGVDWRHEDLALNIWTNPGEWGVNGELSNNGIDDDGNGKTDDWHGWDFIGAGSGGTRQPDNDPMDGTLGHGTNTSGCSSARTDNAIGVAGSSFQSKILAIKASADNSQGVAAGYDGILYAVQMGAKIVNCSWGGTGAFSQALQDIINDANSMGTLVISSSGNNPLDNDYVPHWPSSLDHVLNIGSVESSGAASTWCTYGTTVHTYVPGNGIMTTRRNGGYTNPTGTSFSSPLAAGVAVLVMALHPDWTPDQVATQLRVTSDMFGAQPASKRYGRLNAFRAVSLNQTLSDIPGIRLKSSTVQYDGGGTRFTNPGQKARVFITLENVLAPTSENATATVSIDDPSLSAAATVFPIGNMNTFDTRTIDFEIALSSTPQTSEGYLPVRVRIDDGSYVDFVAARTQIYLDDAWHTALGFGAPYFTDVKATSATTAWAVAHVSNQDLAVRTVTSGGNWSNASGTGFPTGKGVYCIAPVNGQLALVGTGPSSGAAEIFRTTGGGTSWSGVSVSTITGFVNWIHMFDADNGIFQGDPKNNIWGIATTADGGLTWTPLSTPVTAAAGEAGWSTSYASVGDTLWFGSNNSKIYRSTDRGMTWQSFATPSKHSVGISFADALRGAARYAPQDGQGGEYMLTTTTDGGETWNRVTSIQLNTTGGVEMEPYGKRMWLLQGTAAYVSGDMGQTWTAQAVPGDFIASSTTIYSNSSITDVYAGYSNLYKYRSSYQTNRPASVDRTAGASDFRIDYLYPNPAGANGSVLGFTLDAVATARVELYDNLGRLAATELDARLAAGSHSVRIATGKHTPGTYHLRVVLNGQTFTRTLHILN